MNQKNRSKTSSFRDGPRTVNSKNHGPTLEAGRALDALVAEKVMGETLTVPRERAMAIVGAHYVRETGRNFHLQVRNFDITISMPEGETLPAHPTDDNFNQRYFRHATAELLTFPNEVAEIVEQDIQACRIPPRRYSVEIETAWTILERLEADPRRILSEITRKQSSFSTRFVYEVVLRQCTPPFPRHWWAEAAGAPEAICVAALRTLDVPSAVDPSWSTPEKEVAL